MKQRIYFNEVAPRDGFQIEPAFTGIDLARLLEVARQMPNIVGHEVPGQVAKAGRIEDLHPAPDFVPALQEQFT